MPELNTVSARLTEEILVGRRFALPLSMNNEIK